MNQGTIDVQPDQRLHALARANRIRQVRAVLKRGIAAGQLSAAEVILRHRWEVESSGGDPAPRGGGGGQAGCWGAGEPAQLGERALPPLPDSSAAFGTQDD